VFVRPIGSIVAVWLGKFLRGRKAWQQFRRTVHNIERKLTSVKAILRTNLYTMKQNI